MGIAISYWRYHFQIKTFICYVALCTIWYHLYNLENTKSTYGGLLFLVKLHASACNSTKSNTPPLMFFTFLNLYEWYQIQLLCVSFNCFCSSLKKKSKLPGSAIIQAHCYWGGYKPWGFFGIGQTKRCF